MEMYPIRLVSIVDYCWLNGIMARVPNPQSTVNHDTTATHVANWANHTKITTALKKKNTWSVRWTLI
jgi:hypothetical protein